MMRFLLILALLVTIVQFSNAQAPPPACPGGNTITLASTCADACVICGDINGLTGTNSLPDLGQAPPGFCAGQLHNTQWVGFVAGSTSVTLEISVYDCAQGSSSQNGLQIGIYGTTDCESFQLVSNCDDHVPNNESEIFTAGPLTIGGIYFLVIDGAWGDVCSFDIAVLSGNTNPPNVANLSPQIVLSDNTVCPGQTITANVQPPIFGAGVYSWTVNGEPIAYDQQSDLEIMVAGPVQICVTPSNPCSQGVQNCTTINVAELPIISESVTLCDGQIYQWPRDNEVYSEAGVYLYEETTDEGCTQRYQLTVNVNQSTTGFVEGEICEGEIFWVGGEGNVPVTDNGYSEVVLEGANSRGCDSIVSVQLTVHPTYYIAEEVLLCQGEVYQVTDGIQTFNLTTTGVYDFQLQTANGCDSFVQIYLQVFPVPTQPTFISPIICPGDAYDIGDQTFSTPGTYSVLVQTPAGCDSLVIATITINQPVTNLQATICQGESYQVGNQQFTQTGNYTVILPSYVGCDSTINLNLTVQSNPQTTQDVVLCDGETFSYVYEGDTLVYTQEDRDTFFFISSAGCDSSHVLNVLVNARQFTTLNEVICFGDAYALGSDSYGSSGTYTATFMGSNGCDSIVTLNLFVRDEIITNLAPSICEGESYAVGSNSLSQSGNYTFVLTAANGCDSTVNVNLTVIPPLRVTLPQSICAGDSLLFGGDYYFASSTVSDTTTSAVTGCDSITTLVLTVIQPLVTNITTEICSGQSYQVGSQQFDSTGTYTVLLTALSTNCDSIVNLSLTVSDVIIGTGSASICAGETYSVADSAFTQTGIYDVPFVTADGCDSIFRLSLTVIEPLRTSLTELICQEDSYTVGSSVYNQTGVYVDTLLAVSTGCDSIVTLQLTVAPTPRRFIDASICVGGQYTVGSSSYSVSGIYIDTLTNFRGCDSIVTLDLTVTDFYETNLDITICADESYQVGSSVYNQTGQYQNIFISQLGCDSIVNLSLQVNPLLTTQLTETICEGDSFIMGGTSYSSSGIYTANLSSVVTGCDSTVTLNLTVIPTVVSPLSVSICAGETYQVGSQTFSTSGNYSITLSSVVTGCDSIVQLTLNVIQPLRRQLTESICLGDNYQVGSSTYSVSGTYVDTLTAISTGCDSIVTLSLTVIQPLVTNLSITICEGDSYQVGNSVYTTAGSYSDQFTAISTGCDSVVNLTLSITPTVRRTINTSICDGASYQVGNSVYTQAGTYTDLLVSQLTGCDSVVTTNLTINPVYQVTLTEAICNDDSYTIGNQSFNQNGTFVVNLSSVNGCDSIVTLNLTVYPCDLTAISGSQSASCAGYDDGSIQFRMTVGTPPYSYTWQQLSGTATGSGNIAANNQDANITNLVAGSYRITVTDAYNITEIITVTVTEPSGMAVQLTSSDFGGGYQVSCPGANDGFLEATVTGGTAPYSYNWSNGSTAVRIDALPVGAYNLTVTDARGCNVLRSSSLTSSPPINAVIETTDPACFGDASGAVEVVNVSGGTAPYTYRLNGGAETNNQLFSNLPVGQFQVTVLDANGCSQSQLVSIDTPQELTVELGDDVRMNLGDTVQLLATTSYPVVNYQWSGGEIVECPNLSPVFSCDNPIVAPVESAVYRLTVTDAKGCRATDRVAVIVAKPRDVFIPNAFSPNEDGYNERLQIYVDKNVRIVKSFRVFNRWGETMYELYDFDPGDPANGWDGMHRGELMNAGVYVYFAEIEFIDGKVLIYKGDVTLMR